MRQFQLRLSKAIQIFLIKV